MIAFSTSWNSHRHTSGEEMLREIKALGFDLIELGHGIRISLLPGIQKMFDAGEVRFSSLHNFCPLPVEVLSASPDCFQMSALDKSERDRAVKQTLQTIDLAARLQAPFVVLHLGSVAMNAITDELIALAQKGELLSRRCRGYEEIPSEREIPELLEQIAAPHVGYWHDMGHVQIKENLGFLDHADWLRTIAPRTFGCHMQDVKWPARDHQPPFFGDMRLEPLAHLLPSDCQIVWELSPRGSAEEVAQSRAIWKERFGE
ncbi:MAG: hypothetical protein DMF03_12095 [Verrucomicrobia bacterium]|nr:MAG: hypothetical protein DMF03_12095 [Verrucomicrobiota bacterium]